MNFQESPKPGVKPKTSSVNTKTIKAPGTRIERTAQACDRCRAKKVKCDGKLPSCSSCAAVGFKCIVSDKLSRRAFPKGYTETLEERIRQLEAENKKLAGLLDLRDEQIEMMNMGKLGELDSKAMDDSVDQKLGGFGQNQVTTSNLSQLDHNNGNGNTRGTIGVHEHADGCPCNCTNYPNSVHERPVSIVGSFYDCNTDKVSVAGSVNLSDDDDNHSLLSGDDLLLIYSETSVSALRHKAAANNFGGRQINPAPGAFAAATAIARMQKKPNPEQNADNVSDNDRQMLTSLVAMSIPRSTEETLLVPTLLSRICQAYGYSSKPAVLTANVMASLKETAKDFNQKDLPDSLRTNSEEAFTMIMNKPVDIRLSHSEAIYFVKYLIGLPNSRVDMDHLLTLYFQHWGNFLPVLNKNNFLKNYLRVTQYLESGNDVPAIEDNASELTEKFAALLVLVLSLSLLTGKSSNATNMISFNDEVIRKYSSNLHYYDYLIHEFIKPNCILTQFCSMQSLQILTLALEYCLVTGDISTCYELRGRVITMAQQLRLHRCPAAVLGIAAKDGDNVNLQNFMQGERRILFWCVYCLDIYSSLNLGVPRLLKDFEIECALPFAGKKDSEDGEDDEDDNENILIVNNTKLSIVGKVSKLALSVMLYCKVLGRTLDSIFYRFEKTDDHTKASDHERTLECWRRELPQELKFDFDINGFLSDDGFGISSTSTWQKFTKPQLTLIFMYFHAKMLIYLPIISKYGNHLNVGLLQKELLLKGKSDVSSVVSSMSIIQQSATKILGILNSLTGNQSSYLLPIPMNIVREQARFTLLVAKGTLDFIKGGPLYQHLKALLLDTIGSLNAENCHETPGALARNSLKLLELSVLAILGLNLNKSILGPKRKQTSPMPITKAAVERDPSAKQRDHILPKHSNQDDPDHHSLFKHSQDFAAKPFSPTDNADSNNATETLQFASSSLGPDALWSLVDDSTESIENILHFDPFKVNLNNQLMLNGFAADGSLGLVPFLDMNNIDQDDSSLGVDEGSFISTPR